MSAYRHVNIPKTFTRNQLFACMVMKNFQRLVYRGITEQLRDCPSLTEEIALDYISQYTTLQKQPNDYWRAKQSSRH